MLVRLVLMVVGLVLAYGVRRTPTLTILAAAPAPELCCIAHPRLTLLCFVLIVLNVTISVIIICGIFL